MLTNLGKDLHWFMESSDKGVVPLEPPTTLDENDESVPFDREHDNHVFWMGHQLRLSCGNIELSVDVADKVLGWKKLWYLGTRAVQADWAINPLEHGIYLVTLKADKTVEVEVTKYASGDPITVSINKKYNQVVTRSGIGYNKMLEQGGD